MKSEVSRNERNVQINITLIWAAGSPDIDEVFVFPKTVNIFTEDFAELVILEMRTNSTTHNHYNHSFSM